METFNPVITKTTIKLMLPIAASRGWIIHQLDINNAFSHCDLFKNVHMDPPLCYQVPSGHIFKWNRSLYGLKQASR